MLPEEGRGVKCVESYAVGTSFAHPLPLTPPSLRGEGEGEERVSWLMVGERRGRGGGRGLQFQ